MFIVWLLIKYIFNCRLAVLALRSAETCMKLKSVIGTAHSLEEMNLSYSGLA
jgi:hypothetical protein